MRSRQGQGLPFPADPFACKGQVDSDSTDKPRRNGRRSETHKDSNGARTVAVRVPRAPSPGV
jgi:hypothetical protein